MCRQALIEGCVKACESFLDEGCPSSDAQGCPAPCNTATGSTCARPAYAVMGDAHVCNGLILTLLLHPAHEPCGPSIRAVPSTLPICCLFYVGEINHWGLGGVQLFQKQFLSSMLKEKKKNFEQIWPMVSNILFFFFSVRYIVLYVIYFFWLAMRCQFHLTALLVKTTSLLQVLCWKSYHGNKEDLAHHHRLCIMEFFTLLFGEVITLFLFSFS